MPIQNQPVFGLTRSYCVLSGEAANTNFIVFGLTQPGLEPTIYHTRGMHANRYTRLNNANHIFYSDTRFIEYVILLADIEADANLQPDMSFNCSGN